ncbi:MULTISPECIES: glucosaminidase domain-containing protein [unclassified Iodidimonas]|jgi:Bax protein|uniref:glucosaminidase domain-containing protein n=1 Tax=unclassified Iodidimonas TaxID=2626145 RepID=UPI0024827464|nr:MULTISPECIES: glucosaminidase domain-containing protein [unclassified Iodidimonas]
MKKIITITSLAALMVLVFGAAIYQTYKARESALFAERVRYLRHQPPPESLDQLYTRLGFRLTDVRHDGQPVPRIFFSALPQSLQNIDDSTERKRAFMATLLPLILRVNELIMQDRQRLERILHRLEAESAAQTAITPLSRRWLRQLARRYGMGKDFEPTVPNLAALYQRVDIVPPSLALAQAAIESGWGTSRFAREGNALYGQWTWNDEDEGIVPQSREDGKRHRIKAFGFLIDSVRGYAANINRNPAYSDLRAARFRLRQEGRAVDGLALAPTLIRYSERREAYVRDLRLIIMGNDLLDFDQARLEYRRQNPRTAQPMPAPSAKVS